jgi:hypothetical protein
MRRTAFGGARGPLASLTGAARSSKIPAVGCQSKSDIDRRLSKYLQITVAPSGRRHCGADTRRRCARGDLPERLPAADRAQRLRAALLGLDRRSSAAGGFQSANVEWPPNPLYESQRSMSPTDLLPDEIGQAVIATILVETPYETFGTSRPSGQDSLDQSWISCEGCGVPAPLKQRRIITQQHRGRAHGRHPVGAGSRDIFAPDLYNKKTLKSKA